MKLTQMLKEIITRFPSEEEAARNRARADAKYDAMQKSKSKYEVLAQAIKDATGLPTESSDDIIYFPGEDIEWGRGNGPALEAKITSILQQALPPGTDFYFGDYYEGEYGDRGGMERGPENAYIKITE
jgi:hypothetical protein